MLRDGESTTYTTEIIARDYGALEVLVTNPDAPEGEQLLLHMIPEPFFTVTELMYRVFVTMSRDLRSRLG
jgi:predicted metal-dependent enzyme (double-stranded beta helix superfamily)